LGGRQLDCAAFDLRPYKVSPFKPLCVQDQAGSVPPKKLDPITFSTSEDKYLSTEGIGGQLGLDLCGQPVEATSRMQRSAFETVCGQNRYAEGSASRTHLLGCRTDQYFA